MSIARLEYKYTLAITMKTVGLVFKKKKIERSGFIGIEDYALTQGLQVIHMDPGSSFKDQVPVDIIVHKLTNVVGKMRRGNLQAKKEYDNFVEYCQLNPKMIILDEWINVEKVLDRLSMIDYLLPCINPADPLFYIPKNETIHSVKEYPNLSHQLTYPIICKRQTACSSIKSHEMTLIPSINQMDWMKNYEDDEPLLLQEFIQHDGIIVKVYVTDQQIYTFIRPSFINMNGEGDAVHFDSQCLPKKFDYDTIKDPNLDKLFSKSYSEIQQTQIEKESPLDHNRLQKIANLLHQKLGLTFFGFDVLIESNTSKYYIVDVNYFPSFKNVPNFQTVFIDILKKKLNL
ncbi:unnamed protein product [Cunninghamella blakesleeana]